MASATNTLRAATGNQPVQQQKNQSFPAMLERFKGEIAKALPKHLSPDRMARIALTAFRRTPALEKCNPASIFAAVIQASQLGLEPDTLGRAYLIPYGTECQFIPGWKGLVDLVNRSGNASVWTGAVFAGDEFDYELGDRPFVRHKPGENFDVELITHVYAVGRVKGSEWPVIEVWPIGKIWKHLDRYNKVGKRHYAFSNKEMYARKVALLQVLKYMPSTPELSAAISLNDAAEVGSQNLTINDAIEGTWSPVADTEQQQEAIQPQYPANNDTPAAKEPSNQFKDAMSAIKAGDIELAQDLMNGLPGDEKLVIGNLINSRKSDDIPV